MTGYDPAADPVHGSGWNSAARWGGWDWREPRYGDHFRTCSFCGCIHPEDLAAEQASDVCTVCGIKGWHAHFESRGIYDAATAQEEEHPFTPAGWYASWADRKYGWPHKFYIEGLRPRDPSLLHCVGHGDGPDGSRPDWGGNWVRAEDLTRRQKKIIKDDGMHASDKFTGWYLLEPRTTLHAKFYTKHLADPCISDEAKETIARVSGLRFTFTGDGRVGWESYAAPASP